MNKKQAIATSCIALLIALAVFINGRVSGTTAEGHKHSASSPNAPAEHVAYEFLFRRVILFKQTVSAAGQPLVPDFTLKGEARLSDDQVRMLGDIAATCLEEVDALDQKQESSLMNSGHAFRAVNGRLSHKANPLRCRPTYF